MVAIGRLTLRAPGRHCRQFTGAALAGAVLSWALLAAARAADPPATSGRADPPAPAGSEKLVLFDGKSLAGWKPTEFAKAGTVKVEDGAIVMAAGRTMTGITSTRR